MKFFKKALSLVVRLGTSALILFFLFRQVDEQVMFRLVRSSQKQYLLLAFFLFGGVYALCLLRWQMLLRAVGVRLPITRIISAYAGGMFFNLFLPSSIGGDFLRSIDLSVHTKKPNQIIATVLLDRLSGYAGLVLLTLVAAIAGRRLVGAMPAVTVTVGALSMVLIVILVVLFNKTIFSGLHTLFQWKRLGRFGSGMANLQREVFDFSRNGRVLFFNLLLSILIQIASPVVFLLVGRALRIEVPSVYYFIIFPIVGAITMLPISIGGLGVRDALTVYFFSQIGVTRDLAFAMSLVSFFFICAWGAAGGLVYVITVRHRRLQPHAQSACGSAN